MEDANGANSGKEKVKVRIRMRSDAPSPPRLTVWWIVLILLASAAAGVLLGLGSTRLMKDKLMNGKAPETISAGPVPTQSAPGKNGDASATSSSGGR